MTKKVSEITLAEFLKKAKEKDTENILQDEKFGFLAVLKQEGFPENEALQMNMGNAWDFYMNCLINNPTNMLHHFFISSEVNPENVPINRAQLKKITDLYNELKKDFEK